MTIDSGMFLDQRKVSYLNSEGADRPLRSPVAHEVLVRARQYRLARMREQLQAFDCAAILLYDPVNIRYALDASNMQIWTSREATRYALIFADGPAIMFEFKGCHHLCDGLEGIDEVRNSVTWNFMCAGDLMESRAQSWAAEIADLVRIHGADTDLHESRGQVLHARALHLNDLCSAWPSARGPGCESYSLKPRVARSSRVPIPSKQTRPAENPSGIQLRTRCPPWRPSGPPR